MKTALFDRHCALNAKIVPFAGWEMPLHYQGSIPEHRIVRENAGVFDVSHMGLLEISGDEAENLLDYLSTHGIKGHKDGSVTYTVWCLPNGGSVDDLLIFRVNQKHFFAVTNASNRLPDLEHLLSLSQRYQVQIKEHYETHGILAVQGPKALEAVNSLFSIDLAMPTKHFHYVEALGGKIMVSMTGYTGAGGCELIAEKVIIEKLWDELLKKGVAPIGLGARDSLRLEKGYALYGHELSYGIAPTESVAAWAVKLAQREFQGKQALEQLSSSGLQRHAYGIILEEKAIPRNGNAVFFENQQVGLITSGGYSPTLDRSIALILVLKQLKVGEKVNIEIRKSLRPAQVVKLPFV